MENQKRNEEKSKNQDLNLKDISGYIGDICCETYGVLGLVSSKHPLDVILKREKYSEGIGIYKLGIRYNVDIHLIVAYGVKITEVASEVSNRILYFLNRKYPGLFNKINVYVEELHDL
ncbi:MAG: Asp23/Gls24 family envelope stress response protein [Bacillales bacterium]